jgi:exonuclease III
MPIRVVSLNIRHGGGLRIAGLTDWLITKAPSVVVLPEWRNNIPGRYIRGRLTERGFGTVAATRETTKINSVLLAATDLTASWEVTPPSSTIGDLLVIELKQGIQILRCYFPQRQAKAPFFRQCILLAQNSPHTPFLMIGDFNTGRNDLDIEGTGARFHCADLFLALTKEAGLTDLWRARHGDRQDWTWRSTVNGFRIDHVFGNRAFIDRFPAFRCDIDDAPRRSGLTDHSAVVLEID